MHQKRMILGLNTETGDSRVEFFERWEPEYWVDDKTLEFLQIDRNNALRLSQGWFKIAAYISHLQQIHRV
jgi:hypothetical protein